MFNAYIDFLLIAEII